MEAVDGRKGIDSLAALCREKFQADPFSGCLFVFRCRSATAIKVLVYDGQGFWLAQKRLSKGRFPWWPDAAEAKRNSGSSGMAAGELTKPRGKKLGRGLTFERELCHTAACRTCQSSGDIGIRELIAAHPQACRSELSRQLCEACNWRQANGASRDMVCRGLPLPLERAGQIHLRMAEYSLGVYRLFCKFPRQIVLYVGEAPLRSSTC